MERAEGKQEEKTKGNLNIAEDGREKKKVYNAGNGKSVFELAHPNFFPFTSRVFDISPLFHRHYRENAIPSRRMRSLFVVLSSEEVTVIV